MRSVIGPQASVMIASTSAIRASMTASSPPHWPQITTGIPSGAVVRMKPFEQAEAAARRVEASWTRPPAAVLAGAKTLPGSVGRTR